MARGGFKAFQYTFNPVGGAETVTVSEQQEQCKTVLAAMANGLLSLNQGWELDERTSNVEEPYEAAFYGEEYKSFLLLFKHTSGYKLCMHYHARGIGLYYKNAIYTGTVGGSYPFYIFGDFSMAMLPPDKGEFNLTSSERMNANARFLGLCSVKATSPSRETIFTHPISCVVMYRPTDTCKYTLVVRGTTITLIAWCSKYPTRCLAYSIGDIAIPSYNSTLDCKNFASVLYSKGNSELTNPPFGSGLIKGTTKIVNTTGHDNRYYDEQFYSKEGVLRQGYSGSNSGGAFMFHNQEQMLYMQKSITDAVQFGTFNIGSSCPSTSGEYANGLSGYMGIINPEVACYITPNILNDGTLLDGGNYIVVTQGLVIGWDASNTVSLW